MITLLTIAPLIQPFAEEESAFDGINTAITTLWQGMAPLASAACLITFAFAGIKLLFFATDPQSIKQLKVTMLVAFIGFFIFFGAKDIVDLLTDAIKGNTSFSNTP